MSIFQRLRELKDANPPLAYPFVPASAKPPRRRLFLVGQAMTEFHNSQSAVNILVGKGPIYAALTKWTLGERVHGNALRGTFVDALDPPPPDLWEIRVRETAVQARFIGHFAAPDTLVLARLHTRQYLGNRGSHGWQTAMGGSVTSWNHLFTDYTPFSGSTIHDYITEECDDFPI